MGVVGVGMNRHHLTIFDFGLKDAPMRTMGMDAASTHGLPPNNLSQPVGTPAPLLATSVRIPRMDRPRCLEPAAGLGRSRDSVPNRGCATRSDFPSRRRRICSKQVYHRKRMVRNCL